MCGRRERSDGIDMKHRSVTRQHGARHWCCVLSLCAACLVRVHSAGGEPEAGPVASEAAGRAALDNERVETWAKLLKDLEERVARLEERLGPPVRYTTARTVSLERRLDELDRRLARIERQLAQARNVEQRLRRLERER